MHGLMMDTPLLISSIAKHAEKFHGDREIVSVTMDNPRHRYKVRDSVARSRKLANALDKLGLKTGDRVEDRWICTDLMFVPLLEKLLPQIPGVEGFIVMTDEAHMPETSLPNAVCYETLLAAESAEYQWPELDERTASALCYTSGTTGDPKGVLYDHRSTVLHAYAGVAPDALNLSSTDVILPVVPLFHVNAGSGECDARAGCADRLAGIAPILRATRQDPECPGKNGHRRCCCTAVHDRAVQEGA
jgi:fatty-acyl-CoA synthase